MKRNKFKELFFPFISNERTKEVHRVKHLAPNCRIHLLKNGKYRSRRKAKKLFDSGYNGCRWCLKEKDNG